MSITALYAALDPLTGNERLLLYVLLTCQPKSKTALLSHLKTLEVRASPTRALDNTILNRLLDGLQQQGWLQPGDGRGLGELEPTRCSRVLAALSREAHYLQPLAESLRRSAGSCDTAEHLYLQVWLCLFYGHARAMQDALQALQGIESPHAYAARHPCQYLLDADSRPLFDSLLPDVREHLLADWLRLANDWLVVPGEACSLSRQLLDQGLTEDSPLRGELLRQLLWRGDWAAMRPLLNGAQALFGEMFLSLQLGRPEQTLALLDTYQERLRSTTRKRRIELPKLYKLCYCLALLARGDSPPPAGLLRAVEEGKRDGGGAVFIALEMLVGQLQGRSPVSPLHHWPFPLQGFDGVLIALTLHWLEAPLIAGNAWRQTLEKLRAALYAAEYHWLAAELDALLARQYGLPPVLGDWHALLGLQPLIDLYQPQEDWQHVLTALAALRPTAAPGAAASETKPCRLAWLVGFDARGQHCRVEPREQKLNAKGQWSRGRPVALRRLAEASDDFDYLSAQDHRVIALIHSVRDYYYDSVRHVLDGESALYELVGHPALFRQDAPETRFDLVTGSVALQLHEEGEQIRLQLNPGINPAVALNLQWETPTRLLLYPLGREVRQIAELLGSGLSVPQKARAQLVETIGAIAPLLPIHADLPELAAQIDSVPADPKLYAHLLPLEEGLRMQLLVRPLPGGSWLRPGQGAESVLGERDGQPLQARRDLQAERQALEQVLAACPALAEAEHDGHEWQLADPHAALQMLGELQTLAGETLECVWPEGERMRIKARPRLDGLQLNLRQSGEWFTLDGELQLDEGRVLQLRQLLELLRASPGRFVRLDQSDWLALDASLRRRLDELAQLAERLDDDGLRLSPLTAPLLAELADEAGSFKADAAWAAQRARLESLRDFLPEVPGTLQAELRDYQREGFVWLARLAQWGVGACLADDMGLGKTVQTLALLLHRAALGPQLVVAPTSVSLNWLAEASRFAPTLQLHSYRDRRSLDDLGPRDLLVVSYGLLQQDAAQFATRQWSTLVLDEAQAIKNAASKRAKAVHALKADFRLVATGTPVENHLGELWSLMRFLNPGLLGSQERFNQRFAGPIERGSQRARKALKTLIQPFILRRLKSQVLDELPPRTEITCRVPLSAEEAHLYEALRRQALDNLSQGEDGEHQPLQVLAELTRLRRFCCHPTLVLPDCGLPGSKLEAFAEIVEELLDNRHKALVFSQFVDHLAIVRSWLDARGIRYQYLDGSTPAKARQARVEAFQGGDGEIFLISLKAGGSGLNLTAADYVIHLDPWWNPAVEDQASDRAHRMGQQRPVTIYRLVTENTIEERILALHAEKRDLADSLLEGGEVSARLDAEALLALLRGA